MPVFQAPSNSGLPIINDPEFGYQHVNVVDQERSRASLLNWTRSILSVRKQHPAFGRGDLEFVLPEHHAVIGYVRKWEDDVVLCVMNLGPDRRTVSLDLGAIRIL